MCPCLSYTSQVHCSCGCSGPVLTQPSQTTVLASTEQSSTLTLPSLPVFSPLSPSPVWVKRKENWTWYCTQRDGNNTEAHEILLFMNANVPLLPDRYISRMPLWLLGLQWGQQQSLWSLLTVQSLWASAVVSSPPLGTYMSRWVMPFFNPLASVLRDFCVVVLS